MEILIAFLLVIEKIFSFIYYPDLYFLGINISH